MESRQWEIVSPNNMPEEGEVVLTTNNKTVAKAWWYSGWQRWCAEASYDQVWSDDSVVTHWMSIVLP